MKTIKGLIENILDLFAIAIVIPIPSEQHFIYPLSWCLLADICNHTYIPECGVNKVNLHKKTFIDECDMYEHNCDFVADFYAVNYSQCIAGGKPGGGPMNCPMITCPSYPTCQDHNYHRSGDRYRLRRLARRMGESTSDLPKRMFNVRRRYTPELLKIKRLEKSLRKSLINNNNSDKIITPCKTGCNRKPEHNVETYSFSEDELSKPTIVTHTTLLDERILRTEHFWKNGIKMMRVFKTISKNTGKVLKYVKEESKEFLE